MKIAYYILCLTLLGCSATKSVTNSTTQNTSFEGYVTYKIMSVKPDMIPQEDWDKKIKEIMGDQGYFLKKNYYRPYQFASDINTGLEVGKEIYNPIDSLHYSWHSKADTVYTQDHNKESRIKVKEFIDLDTTTTINNVLCHAVKVKFTIGQVIVWYNPDIIKMTGDEYKGTSFEKAIVKNIKTLPVRYEIPSMLIIEMIEYKSTPLDDDVFKIPQYKEVIELPTF